MDEQPPRRKQPWWIWLVILLFPLPLARAPWRITVVLAIIFVVLVVVLTTPSRDK